MLQSIQMAYLFIYFGTIFFGNIGAFTSLWIAFQGQLGTWGVPLVLVVIFASNVTGDILWYSMGRGLRSTRFGTWIKNHLPKHEVWESKIEEKGLRWMLFAKFAYGTNFPILFSLGWTKISFKKFFRRSLLAIVIWLPIILGVSYGLYSTLSPLAAEQKIKSFEIYFLAALVGFIVIQYVLAKIIAKIFNSEEGAANRLKSFMNKK